MTDFCKTRLYLNIYITPCLLAPPFHFNFRNKPQMQWRYIKVIHQKDIIFTIYKLYSGKSCCIILNKLNWHQNLFLPRHKQESALTQFLTCDSTSMFWAGEMGRLSSARVCSSMLYRVEDSLRGCWHLWHRKLIPFPPAPAASPMVMITIIWNYSDPLWINAWFSLWPMVAAWWGTINNLCQNSI